MWLQIYMYLEEAGGMYRQYMYSETLLYRHPQKAPHLQHCRHFGHECIYICLCTIKTPDLHIP